MSACQSTCEEPIWEPNVTFGCFSIPLVSARMDSGSHPPWTLETGGMGHKGKRRSMSDVARQSPLAALARV